MTAPLTLQALATEIRAVNAANGWGEDWNLRIIGDYLHLVQTEVTEAYRATHAERPEELADIVIRCLDICELIEAGLVGKLKPQETLAQQSKPHMVSNSHSFAVVYMQLHMALTDIHEVYRKQFRDEGQEEQLRVALVSGLLWVVALAVSITQLVDHTSDFESVLLAKLEKNRARGYRHGGLRT